jgi:hypothetical protein
MFWRKKRIFGATESVIFPDFAKIKIVAKVDTGAFSGALHAENICENVNGELEFEIENQKFYSQKFTKIIVKSATGHEVERYKIPVKMKIHGKNYATEITLANRESLTFDMLLGRKFLEENKILVDVSRKTVRKMKEKMK